MNVVLELAGIAQVQGAAAAGGWGVAAERVDAMELVEEWVAAEETREDAATVNDYGIHSMR